MKKRLLITSIVMMLVCAVALSTATYAWFTSNASVSASTMTLKAASSDASSLGIGWTGFAAQSAITSQIYETLKPMAPDVLDASKGHVALQNGVTTYEYAFTTPATGDPANIQFYTSTVKELESVLSFNNLGANFNEKPVVYTKTAGEATADDKTDVRSFYVKNLSKANTVSSITVTPVFPGSGDGEIKYSIVTAVAPINGTRYFTKNNNGTFDEIKNTPGGNQDYTYLINNGFDSDKTYYEIAYTFIKSKDTKVNADTKYYEFAQVTFGDGSGEVTYTPNKYYTKTSEGLYMIDSGATASESDHFEKRQITTHVQNADPSTSKNPVYYEELKGDDMIRVALFTKRYNVAVGAKLDGTKYYKYNAATGIMDDGRLGSDNSLNLISVFDGTEGYYVAEDNHTLLGVLGKEATAFTKAATYDKNATYFKFTKDDNPSVANLSKYYEISGNTYVKTTDTQLDAQPNYYTVSQVKVVGSDETPDTNKGEEAFVTDTYYTATSTVANGQIQVNKPVKDLNYYTDVTTSLTFAEELKPGEQVDIIAVVWLDGTALDDTRSGQLAQVSLLFNSNGKQARD